jgi:hypothetical protein
MVSAARRTTALLVFALSAACSTPVDAPQKPQKFLRAAPVATSLELVLAPSTADGRVAVVADWTFDARVATPIAFDFGGRIDAAGLVATGMDGGALAVAATPSGFSVAAAGETNRITLSYTTPAVEGLVLAERGGAVVALVAQYGAASDWLATPQGAVRLRVGTTFELPNGWSARGPGDAASSTRFTCATPVRLDALTAVAGEFVRIDTGESPLALHVPGAFADAAAGSAQQLANTAADLARVLGAAPATIDVVYTSGLVAPGHTPGALVAPGLVVAPVEWLGTSDDLAREALSSVAAGIASQWIGTPAHEARMPDFWRGVAAHTVDWLQGGAFGSELGAKHLDQARTGAAAAGSYERGYATANLARQLVGDGPYVHALKSASPITDGRAFLDALEKAGGVELDATLAPWIEGRGVPVLALQWNWLAKDNVVELVVDQRQTPSEGVARIFTGPVDVEIVSGRRIARHRVELTKRTDTFRLPCDAAPTWTRFDASLRLPFELATPPERNGVLARAARGETSENRIDALREVARLAREQDAGPTRQLLVTPLSDALWRDPSSWVREVAARELGTLGGLEARATLERAAREDRDTAVRTVALTRLERWAPDPALALLAADVFARSNDTSVRIAAARLLARADPARAAAFVVERLDVASPHDRLRAELIDLWSRTDAPDVDTTLAAFAADPLESDTVRATAFTRLVERTRSGRREPEGVAELLDARDPRWRAAALDTLARSQSGGARAALAAFARDAASRPEAGRAAAALERR